MKRKVLLLLIIFFAACSEQKYIEIAKLNTIDKANKAVILLNSYNIFAELTQDKEFYSLLIDKKNKLKARKILTDFNIYFEQKSLNDLLESKFSSLSQLEIIKANLLKSREIYNNLNKIPKIFSANVIYTGDKTKSLSVLIVSLYDLDETQKKHIEYFLNGLIKENDKLSISYFVINNKNELPI